MWEEFKLSYMGKFTAEKEVEEVRPALSKVHQLLFAFTDFADVLLRTVVHYQQYIR
jgi:hypothetical protein